jgi:polysaccharide deacetylase family protein (PEP-CTERM system associated)
MELMPDQSQPIGSQDPMAKLPAILLTIDVEDWFQVENLRPMFPPDLWERQTARVEWATNRLLDLFDSFEERIQATFFVLGWVAERFPRLVAEIKRRGHEVASHGYGHLLNYRMQREALQADLNRSKSILEQITGAPVLGYRAPCFSINDNILKCVQNAGYRYDSSYNSFDRNGRYGVIDTSSGMRRQGIALRLSSDFVELPISNMTLLGQTIPWGGGGYFRLIPPSLFRSGVRCILKQRKAYMLYLHPWEIDPGQPRIKGISRLAGFRHYLNIANTYQRVSRLISAFHQCRFMTCSQYIRSLQSV